MFLNTYFLSVVICLLLIAYCWTNMVAGGMRMMRGGGAPVGWRRRRSKTTTLSNRWSSRPLSMRRSRTTTTLSKTPQILAPHGQPQWHPQPSVQETLPVLVEYAGMTDRAYTFHHYVAPPPPPPRCSRSGRKGIQQQGRASEASVVGKFFSHYIVQYITIVVHS
jgi:hypothetical protein